MRELIRDFSLLEELGEEGREVLADHLEDRPLEHGCALFRSGQEASELFLVAQGGVRLERDGEDIGSLKEGDVLGGASLVAIGKRECDAFAEGLARVFVLPLEGYLRLRMERPDVALALQEALLRTLSGDVRAFLPEYSGGS